ncbi:MAG: aldehyde dehydrogenase [Rhodospirillaceae bacterium]|nr:aldehyde dehydrogenase [Alphaproteobacteria bacterium]MBR71641.1 aldehyde dehydrogenase [Rhodospirillaceae bacterium]
MTQKNSELNRRDVVKNILKNREKALVVTGLGGTCWDVTAAGDSPHNFPMWGGMGGAPMVGLGLSLAQPKRTILVITGDGEMLMGLGSLATIGAKRPKNLSLIVIDNEHYGETGMQKTHTGMGTNISMVGKAAGFPFAETISNVKKLNEFIDSLHLSEGPKLAVIKVSNTQDPLVLPPRDGSYLKDRFRSALLGEEAIK